MQSCFKRGCSTNAYWDRTDTYWDRDCAGADEHAEHLNADGCGGSA
jgi:hypothetical protein